MDSELEGTGSWGSDIHCRGCLATLVSRSSLVEGGFLLPSTLWDAFADCVACEECFPYRMESRLLGTGTESIRMLFQMFFSKRFVQSSPGMVMVPLLLHHTQCLGECGDLDKDLESGWELLGGRMIST